MPERVDIQSKGLVFDDEFKIQEAKLQFQKFDGQMSKPIRRLVFERGDSAAAILFNTDTQKVLLIKQFRYPTYEKGPGWLTEIVAGMIDPGEQPEETIRREIHEEIGYQVKTLMPIVTFYVSPGGSSERIMLYYAEVENADRVDAGGGLVAENEDIQLVEIAAADLWKSIEHGEIQDAKTLIAVQWLQMRLAAKG